MDSLDPIERQRAELESVLSSEAFQRAPNLSRLLKFLCEKQWEGKGGDIKEYTLAVEVLGRPADFDPLTNSIVRVELHRLREKLKHYYEDPSHQHKFRIHIPSGTYVPEFLTLEVPEQKETPAQELLRLPSESADVLAPTLSPREFGVSSPVPAATPGAANRRPRRFPLRLVLGGLSAVVVFLLLGWGWRASRIAQNDLGQSSSAPSRAPLPSPTLGQEVRIRAGYTKGEYYTDRLGHTWLSDRYFNGGVAISFPRQVTALATDLALFETARMGRFAYAIPLSPGTYELSLYFMERLFGPGTPGRQEGENSRLFNVLVNGKLVLSSFDAYAEAKGSFIGHVRGFKGVRPGSDGFLRIEFMPLREEPFVNAIEIIPTPEGRVPPIRIVAQGNSVTDSQGHIWEADRYYRGGVPLRRQQLVVGTPDPDLYTGERYGHFSYVIPVPEGSYRLTLYFSEAYFGSQDSGMGGAGSRVFDLYCNGRALLRDFDVFREAGGANRALVKSFPGLRPNPQGQLVLDFVPAKNYALVNAIEVVEESQE